jgi:hypothetical protein
MTFREKAMRLLDARRTDFLLDMDEQDRVYRERKGKAMLDWQKINPHRVQMFSIQEIWRCVQQRLIELDVMKDPDAQQVVDDGDSTELEEDFDFVEAARARADTLFKKKKSKESKDKALGEMMKKNDLKIVNRMLTLAADQVEIL